MTWHMVILTCQHNCLHKRSNVGCNWYFHHVYKHQTSPGNSCHSCTCLELNFGRCLTFSHFFKNFHLYVLEYICLHKVQSCCYGCFYFVVSSVDIGGDMEQFQVNNPEHFLYETFHQRLYLINTSGLQKYECFGQDILLQASWTVILGHDLCFSWQTPEQNVKHNY